MPISWEDMPTWTTKQAARYLGKTQNTLRKWANDGLPETWQVSGAPELKTSRENNRIYFDAQDVRDLYEWLSSEPEEMSAPSTPAPTIPLPEGVRKYNLYLKKEQRKRIVSFIKEQGWKGKVRFERAN